LIGGPQEEKEDGMKILLLDPAALSSATTGEEVRLGWFSHLMTTKQLNTFKHRGFSTGIVNICHC